MTLCNFESAFSYLICLISPFVDKLYYDVFILSIVFLVVKTLGLSLLLDEGYFLCEYLLL